MRDDANKISGPNTHRVGWDVETDSPAEVIIIFPPISMRSIPGDLCAQFSIRFSLTVVLLSVCVCVS
jgi:hypothetical protein